MNPLSGNLKRLLPVGFAIVMGLVAVGLMQNYLGQQRRLIEAERRKIEQQLKEVYSVIVAKREIAEGAAVTAADLTMKEIPKQFIQPYATGKIADLEGLFAMAPFAVNEQVLTNKVRRASDVPMSATLSGLTPEDRRAITIGTDAVHGVGGFVRPGDMIDILWTVELPENQGGEKVTFTLFQNIAVLAVGNEMIGKIRSEKEPGDRYSVTLSLTPREASILLYAREQGLVQLSLRSRANKGDLVNIPPADSRALLGTLLGEQSATPLPPPATPHTVEVFKGLERTVVQVQKE